MKWWVADEGLTPLKSDVRFLGLDDAPFGRDDAMVPVVGVVTRGPLYVEGVLTTRVDVDGDDATTVLLRALRRSRFRTLWRAVFLNGIFVGGFNLVDPDRLHDALAVPVIAVVRSRPRPARVRLALKAAFGNWEERWHRIRELEPTRLPGVSLWATVRGASTREAVRLVEATTVRGHLPEPLRLAHVIASGVVRGESRGRA